ncbi:MAG: molybdopterin molybdotransferase MoeA [Alphaproteobacteria bacterium]|nr:molybdopterin molybdotransferase MoeA [Alphaproteobacteria bacterium]
MSPRSNLLNDCFLHDKDRMRHDEVIELLVSRLSSVAEPEIVSLRDASGRILAGPVKAPRNVPMHDNSAVDGYAFAHADYENATSMPVGPRIAAGDQNEASLQPGEAARIFTGAAMPQGADTVAMQEDCTLSEDGSVVSVPPGLKTGANRRMAGEDVAAGDTILDKGQRLRPQDLAALASLGAADISVFQKLRIGLVSSGNELVRPAPSAELTLGQVFDSNHPMLEALCQSQPVDINDLGIVEDNRSAVQRILSEAAANHDVILTTGGASGGDEDHMVHALDQLGQRHLWQIAIKPGRPMSFGQIGNCVFLGLPGNPVAAFICFLLYCLPVIRILSGGVYREPMRIPVAAGFEIARKKIDRREFQRGWLEADDDGSLVARKFPRDGSGLISGLCEANGLIEIPEEVDRIVRGDLVRYIPFSEFGLVTS